MVTSTASDGALHARPMTPQQVSDELEAGFFISRSSEQAADIAAQPLVNLFFDGSSDWLSVAGSATLVDDRASGVRDVEPGDGGVVPRPVLRPRPGAAARGRAMGGVLERARWPGLVGALLREGEATAESFSPTMRFYQDP